MIALDRSQQLRPVFLAIVCTFALGLFSASVSSSPLTESVETRVPNLNDAVIVPQTKTWQEQKDEMLFDMSQQPELTADTKKMEKTLALVQQGNYVEAQQELERFITNNSKFGPAYEILGLVFLLQNKMDDAIRELQKAVALDRNNSSALTKLGSIYMGQQQNDKAKQVLLQAIAINPNDRFAQQRLGMLSEEAHEYDKAVSFYELGIKGTAPGYIGVKVNLAGLYNNQRQFSKTIALLEPVLTSDTKNVSGHILLGTAYLYTDQADKAIKQFQSAVAIDPVRGAVPLAIAQRLSGKAAESKQVLLDAEKAKPNDPVILFELAETYSRLSQYEEAYQGYLKAIEVGYPKTPAWRRVATLQMTNKKYTEAIHTLRQVTAGKEGSMQDQFVLGEAYQLNRQFSEAEKVFQTLCTQYPKDPNTWYRLGLHYGLTRNYDLALQNLNKAATISPENPDILKALALAFLQSGKMNEALLQAQALNRVQPPDVNNAFFLASLYQEAGKIAEATKGYKDILAATPGHGPSLNNLADLSAQSGDLAGALNLARQAVAVAPENSRYLDTLGWILLQNGELDTAVSTLEKAHALSPEVAVFNFHLGNAYFKKGDKDKAKPFLQASMSKPSVPWAEEAGNMLKLMD